jgi:glycosyltransferase involved in cell wall biosynthesis
MSLSDKPSHEAEILPPEQQASILVPVRAGDAEGLHSLLCGLAAEAEPLRGAVRRLVVVNDGPDPRTGEVARAFSSFPVEIIELKGPNGPGRARNAALERIDMGWAVSLDCHLLPAAGFGIALRQALRNAHHGRLYLLNSVPEPLHSASLAAYFHLTAMEFEAAFERQGWIATGLVMLHSASPHRLRFPEPLTAAEDYRLVLKARASGVALEFLPEVALHYPIRKLRDYAALRQRRLRHFHLLELHFPDTPPPVSTGFSYLVYLHKALLYRLSGVLWKAHRRPRLQSFPAGWLLAGVLTEWIFEWRSWLMLHFVSKWKR